MEVEAGEAPVVVTGSYGQGKVAVVAVAPLGTAPKGTTVFWDAPEWLKFMATLAGWLLE